MFWVKEKCNDILIWEVSVHVVERIPGSDSFASLKMRKVGANQVLGYRNE